MGLPSPYTTVTAQIAGIAPQLQVRSEGLEVSQVIQNLRHQVPLIAGKTTVVRSYLSLAAGIPPIRCRGELSVTLANGMHVNVAWLNEVVVSPLDWSRAERATGRLESQPKLPPASAGHQ